MVIWAIILVPNLFAIWFGVASFPYTCAPMFAHQVNDQSKLCVFKFEGSNACRTLDLDDNYGRNEIFFIRYFFSKVYGSADKISPFDTRLSDTNIDFHQRMDDFFENYSSYLKIEERLLLDRITIKVKQVDVFRHDIAPCEVLGYYDVKLKKYTSSYEITENKS